jgi:exodeoxyribonuclease-3
MTPGELSLLTFNIGNPSAERAERQLAWLAGRDEHILVLTETKASAGCQLLADAFGTAGWAVAFPVPDNGDYGTMIVSRLPATPVPFGDQIGYLPARAAAVRIDAGGKPLLVTGLYVPSRDASPEKIERKRKWLAACGDVIGNDPPAILLGDLNILEPDHQPRYPFFVPFEYDFYRSLTGRHGMTDMFRRLHTDLADYSWVGRTGDGYRYDHAFCAGEFRDYITTCEYVHEPRVDRLSDHSALTVRLSMSPPEPLPVTDPANALVPPTLF